MNIALQQSGIYFTIKKVNRKAEFIPPLKGNMNIALQQSGIYSAIKKVNRKAEFIPPL